MAVANRHYGPFLTKNVLCAQGSFVAKNFSASASSTGSYAGHLQITPDHPVLVIRNLPPQQGLIRHFLDSPFALIGRIPAVSCMFSIKLADRSHLCAQSPYSFQSKSSSSKLHQPAVRAQIFICPALAYFVELVFIVERPRLRG